jgi:hypothetical protein
VWRPRVQPCAELINASGIDVLDVLGVLRIRGAVVAHKARGAIAEHLMIRSTGGVMGSRNPGCRVVPTLQVGERDE